MILQALLKTRGFFNLSNPTTHFLSRTTIFNSFSSSSLLPGKKDIYNGFLVDSAGIPQEASQFDKQLKYSMNQWKKDKIKSVWVVLENGKLHLS